MFNFSRNRRIKTLETENQTHENTIFRLKGMLSATEGVLDDFNYQLATGDLYILNKQLWHCRPMYGYKANYRNLIGFNIFIVNLKKDKKTSVAMEEVPKEVLDYFNLEITTE